MKKAYVKPEIELESFQFSANVAGECQANSIDNSCQIFGEGGIKFFTNFDCHIDPMDPDFCQHVPTADTTVFTS